MLEEHEDGDVAIFDYRSGGTSSSLPSVWGQGVVKCPPPGTGTNVSVMVTSTTGSSRWGQ